jgi:hypothetical protein
MKLKTIKIFTKEPRKKKYKSKEELEKKIIHDKLELKD